MQSTLGPFILERRLGETFIWKARDTRNDKVVILRALPAYMDTEENAARFQREIELLEQNDGSGLGRFLEQGRISTNNHELVGSASDKNGRAKVLYLVREYIEGFPLAAALRDGALPIEKALELAVSAARALNNLHRLGWAHRNINPRSIFLALDGEVRLIEFGLIRQLDEERRSFKTDPGQILGTAGYMAPEQFRGGEVSEASDLFAFGVVLYQMISGERPFPTDNLLSYMSAIEAGQAFQPLAEKVPGTPREVDQLIERLLAVDPAERPTSAAELIGALEGLLAHRAEPETRKDDISGLEIGPFRIEERLRGPMVFRATDMKHDRRVFLRLLSSNAETEEVVGRFMRELAIERNLEHPRFARYYGDGMAVSPSDALGAPEGSEVFYFSREYVEGDTLESSLAKGPFELGRAVKIAAQLAEGIAALHALDVVHRNLYPETVALNRYDQAKIVDLSLLKVMGDYEGFQTQVGKRIGPVGYSAPETLRGQPASNASDLFSIGALLFHMVTGRTPFPAETMLDYIAAIESGLPAPRLSTEVKGVAPELDALIASLLALDPAERPASAVEVRAQFEKHLEREPAAEVLVDS